jgi:hypothetical protein
VLTVEATKDCFFEEFVAAVIQTNHPCILENINQASNVLAENRIREHLEDLVANDFVIELYKRHQEFKEDVRKGHLVKTAKF